MGHQLGRCGNLNVLTCHRLILHEGKEGRNVIAFCRLNFSEFIILRSIHTDKYHNLSLRLTILILFQVKVRQVNKGDSKPDDVMNANFTAILQVSSFNPAAGKTIFLIHSVLGKK